METQRKKTILAIYDIAGIQEYIFASNRLRENAGASRIVGRALREELEEILRDNIKETRLINFKDIDLEKNEKKNKLFRSCFNSEIQTELIYSGGGKAVLVFQTKEIYNKISRELAKRVFETGYQLTVLTAYIETDFTDYNSDIQKLNQKLLQIKARQPYPLAFGTFPIEQQENGSRQAIAKIRNGEYLSIPQVLKIEEYKKSPDEKKFAVSIYHRAMPAENVHFAYEMKDLVPKRNKNNNSYVAVVHIDGNGMGQYISKAIKGDRKHKSYADIVPLMRKISKEISDVNQEIFKELLDISYQVSYEVLQKDELNEKILPIRPIILDGDDVTFICKAEWGIPLCTIFIRNLLKKQNGISACAGIALVHNHFPFQIAYEIAEECCSRAKKEREEKQREGQAGADFGYLDYELIRGSYVEQEEKKEYFSRYPYRIEREERKEINSIDHLFQLNHKMRNTKIEKGIIWPHSRLVKIYEAYRKGKEYIRTLQAEFSSRGYELSELAGVSLQDGFYIDIDKKQKTPLYQALELIDFLDLDLYKKINAEEEELK